MIISYAGNFIFFKTIKTAGTSVEIALSRYCGTNDIITYLPEPDEEIRQRLGYRGPQNAFNPILVQFLGRLKGLGRIERRFRYHHNMRAAEAREIVSDQQWKNLFKFTIVRNPFDRAISKFYHDYYRKNNEKREYSPAEISEYIAALPYADLTNWHIYTEENQILVDRIVKYEFLETEIRLILSDLGLSGTMELPRAKTNFRSNREHYSRVLGYKARARIEAAASNEIETFRYYWNDL